MTPAAIVSQVVSAVGWVVVIGIAWRLSDTLATMRTQIGTILTNHLPHIYDELKELRADRRHDEE